MGGGKYNRSLSMFIGTSFAKTFSSKDAKNCIFTYIIKR